MEEEINLLLSKIRNDLIIIKSSKSLTIEFETQYNYNYYKLYNLINKIKQIYIVFGKIEYADDSDIEYINCFCMANSKEEALEIIKQIDVGFEIISCTNVIAPFIYLSLIMMKFLYRNDEMEMENFPDLMKNNQPIYYDDITKMSLIGYNIFSQIIAEETYSSCFKISPFSCKENIELYNRLCDDKEFYEQMCKEVGYRIRL